MGQIGHFEPAIDGMGSIGGSVLTFDEPSEHKQLPKMQEKVWNTGVDIKKTFAHKKLPQSSGNNVGEKTISNKKMKKETYKSRPNGGNKVE